MKITAQQLPGSLNKQITPVYLVSGDDLFLKQTSIKQIRQAAQKQGFNEQQKQTLETGFDWDGLYSTLCSPSLFSSKQIIEINMLQSLPTKAGSEVLQSYSKNPNPDIILIINLPKADAKITKAAWFKALDDIGAHIVIWPLKREQIPQWIKQRIQNYNMQIQPAAANLLADFCEGNLAAAAQAIEKLFLLQPQSEISTADIQQVISDQSKYTIFDFSEACLGGNTTRALQILHHLKEEGSEPTLILWSLTREIRIIVDIMQAIAQQQSFDSLCQKHRIFATRQQSIRHFIKQHNLDDCKKLLSAAAELDRSIKGCSSNNPWNLFEIFCLRLS